MVLPVIYLLLNHVCCNAVTTKGFAAGLVFENPINIVYKTLPLIFGDLQRSKKSDTRHQLAIYHGINTRF